MADILIYFSAFTLGVGYMSLMIYLIAGAIFDETEGGDDD